MVEPLMVIYHGKKKKKHQQNKSKKICPEMPFEKGRKEGLIFQSHPIFRCFFPLAFEGWNHPLFLHQTVVLSNKIGGRRPFLGVWEKNREKLPQLYAFCRVTSKMAVFFLETL